MSRAKETAASAPSIHRPPAERVAVKNFVESAGSTKSTNAQPLCTQPSCVSDEARGCMLANASQGQAGCAGRWCVALRHLCDIVSQQSDLLELAMYSERRVERLLSGHHVQVTQHKCGRRRGSVSVAFTIGRCRQSIWTSWIFAFEAGLTSCEVDRFALPIRKAWGMAG